MLIGPEMHALVDHFAAAGKLYAQSISPHGETGDYRRSFRVERGLNLNVTLRPGKRAVARLHNDSDHALSVEYVIERDGQRILTRTMGFIEGWHP